MARAEQAGAGRSELEQQLELTCELALGMSELDTVDLALRDALEKICRSMGWNLGQAWLPGADEILRCRASWHEDPSLASFATVSGTLALVPGEGLPGWVLGAGRPAWLPDLQSDPRFRRGPAAAEAGLTAGMAVPVLAERQTVAVLEFFVRKRREEDDGLVRLISAVAAQLGSFILRKQTEEALRESEARFRAVVETAQDAVISADSTGKIIYFNEGAQRTFGHRVGEAIGSPLTMLMPESVRSAHAESFARVLRTGGEPLGGRTVELTGERSGGSRFPLELSVARWKRGSDTFFTGIIRDISARKQAQAEIEAREAKLSEAQSLAVLGSFDWNTGRQAATWSRELYRICGVDLLDFEPTTDRVLALLHPDEVAWLGEEVQAALRDGRRVKVEHRIVRPNGEIRMVESRLEAVAGEDGRTERLIGTCRDITEQWFEAELRREAEQRFRVAFTDAPIGMILVAPDGRLLEANQAMCEILGTSEEALLGAPLQQFTHPDEVDKDAELLRRLVAGELETIRAETRYIGGCGETIFVRASASIVREPDGKPRYLIGQIEDITERGKTERALRESREQLRVLLDNLTAAVYLKDLDGRYVLANHEAAAIARRPVNELIGSTDEELFSSHLAARFRAQDQRALESEGPIEYEQQIQRDDGVHTYLSQMFVLRDERGSPYAIGGIATDISERVRVEGENRRLESQVHRFERLESVGRLAGGVAHDFNNLLAIIINYAALAAEGLSPQSDTSRDLGEIRGAAERAASLTRQLLAFSRQERFEPEVLRVDRVVSDAEPLLRSVIGENIELTLAHAPDLMSVMAGQDQLHRVLLNLTLNARDAMPTGGRLSVMTANVASTDDRLASLMEQIPAGDYVCLSIADTGGGMPEAVAARAFEPFFSTKPPAEGTGLGLATVYGLVCQMEGGIELESAPGGTTVRVYLPAAERSPTDMPAETDDEALVGKGARILVVEDEPAVRALVARILERDGYEVIAAAPDQAIDEATVAERPIDLLITDVVMPGISGADLADTLSSRQPGLPVVFMSGYSDEAVLRNDLRSGEASLLSKPFTPAELRGCVARALTPPRARPDAA